MNQTRGLPGGTPIGVALVLPLDPEGRPLREAVAQIDRVHGNGDIPPIAVKRGLLQGPEGYYDPRPPYGIAVGSQSVHPNLTMVHETGHLLDHLCFGAPGTMASADSLDPLLQPWRDAVVASQAVRDLTALQARYAGTSYERPVAYLLTYPELWARSYAQFVTVRSGDPGLAAQLDARRTLRPGTTYLPRQWDDADFVPIAAAIDDLFEGLGWIV